MWSRRRFLGLGALTAGAAAGAGCITTQPSETGEPTPASIAALEPLAEKPVPISADEQRARVEAARGLMREHDIDALLMTGGTSLVYFTGVRWGLSERLFAVTIPREGQPFVVTPAFEEDRTHEQLESGPFADVRVREAVAHAIDRQAIIDGAMFGYGTPIGTHFAPHHAAYKDLTGLYPPDLDQATVR